MSELELAKARARAAAAKKPSHETPDGFYMGPERGFISDEEAAQPQMSVAESVASGMGQGFTAGGADEMALPNRDAVRAENEAAQEQHPWAEAAGRFIGGVASPINKVIGPVRGVGGAVVAGGKYGAAEGFLSGEESAAERLKSAGWGVVTGAGSGGLTGLLGRGAHKSVKAAFNLADKRPSLSTFKSAKDRAYAAVRKSGVAFDKNATTALMNRLDRNTKTVRYELDPNLETDKAPLSFLESLRNRVSQGDISLNKLDSYRQRAWRDYKRTEHPFYLKMIQEIDATISQAAEGDDLIRAARQANRQHANLELLDWEFYKDDLQTASTGSGGNILNKYRQTVTSILTDKNKRQFFDPEMIEIMESFVHGTKTENILRRAGKMAPGGNGLMTALATYAAAAHPEMLAVTAASQAAKSAADSSVMRGKEAILDSLSGFTPRPAPNLNRMVTGGAAAGSSLAE